VSRAPRERIRDLAELVLEHRLTLPRLPTQPVIRIYKLRENLFAFTQSHFVHTPKQMGPHMTNACYGDTLQRTFRRALDTFVYYFFAIRAGYKPKESWLVKNSDFW
jgi:hypothetical protein